MVNCVGGIQVLFPLLEQVNKVPIPKDVLSPDAPMIENLNKSVEHEDWLVVPSSSYAGILSYVAVMNYLAWDPAVCLIMLLRRKGLKACSEAEKYAEFKNQSLRKI